MINRYHNVLILHQVRQLTDKEQLVLQLERQYPADIGVIAAFFLNHVKLSPGEALFLGANEPHAYLSGECIECMATSDNVVRAGLTPKHRDVQTLCSMLTYKQVNHTPRLLLQLAFQSDIKFTYWDLLFPLVIIKLVKAYIQLYTWSLSLGICRSIIFSSLTFILLPMD